MFSEVPILFCAKYIYVLYLAMHILQKIGTGYHIDV